MGVTDQDGRPPFPQKAEIGTAFGESLSPSPRLAALACKLQRVLERRREPIGETAGQEEEPPSE